MLANFIAEHASSLRDLNLCIIEHTGITASTLIENQIHLRSLTTSPEVSLLSYLSSAGDLLEVLEVRYQDEVSVSMDDLIVAVTTSCPKALCLSHTFRRSQCKQVTLRLKYGYYDPVVN
eukprot:scaffold600_cov193-Ochromonas_danica.AAC.2